MDAKTDEFNPFAPEVVENPYPWYRRLRERSPVYHNDRLDLWVLSRYADVSTAVHRHDVLSSADGMMYVRLPLPFMLSMDQPEHTRLRKLVSRAFTPRAVERWRPAVDRLVERRVGALLSADESDFVAAVAVPLPVAVIGTMLGAPEDDWPRLKHWSDGMIAGFYIDSSEPDPAIVDRVVNATIELRVWCDEFLARRRSEPREDTLSLLLDPAAGEALDDEELFWFTALLLVAGDEAMTFLLGNLVLALAEHPAQWDLLRERPSLVEAAVEESLRYDSPIQGFHRTAKADYVVRGTKIPEGARVLLLFGSANRDPTQYPQPDSFLIERDPQDHLAFSSGIHHCLGAALGRMQTSTVLRLLVQRAQRIELAGVPVRTTNPANRGLASLPVRISR